MNRINRIAGASFRDIDENLITVEIYQPQQDVATAGETDWSCFYRVLKNHDCILKDGRGIGITSLDALMFAIERVRLSLKQLTPPVKEDFPDFGISRSLPITMGKDFYYKLSRIIDEETEREAEEQEKCRLRGEKRKT